MPSARRTGGARLTFPSRLEWLNPGWLVLIASVLLAGLGAYCVSVASWRDPVVASTYAMRHLTFAGLGLLIALFAMVPHYRRIAMFAWPVGILSILMLAVLLIPFVPTSIVQPRNGARRWIDLGFTDFQPSELAKVAYVLVTAGYLRFRSNYRTLLGLIPPGLIALVPMALIVIEPDLGTGLLFLPTLLAMLIAAGAKMRHLIATCMLGAVAAATILVACLVFAERDQYPLLKRHQVKRIQDVVARYKGDESQADEASFQGMKATTLVGAGGVFGLSDSKSRAMIRASRLPEAHNDMIFSVLVNRFGLVGAFGTIGLYTLWIGSALWVAGRCKDPFGRLVVVGLVATTATAAVIHMGENLGVLPITGITLPFVSYGGTSLLTTFLMVGLICNVGLRRPEYLWRKSFEFGEDEDIDPRSRWR